VSISYEQSGRVVTLTLNRPDTRNALSADVVDALVEGLGRANADPSVSCIILTGAGDAFCSGGNLHELRGLTEEGRLSQEEIAAWYRNGIQRIPATFHGLDVVTIAAVQGAAIGAGCDLAAMCDLRVAAPGATFAETFVRLGLISGDGGAWFLPRLIGLARAREMMLTARPVGARQAFDWGLVNALADEGRLLETAREMAEGIAALPPGALRATKQLLRGIAEGDFDRALAEAARMQAMLHRQPHHREAISALLARQRGDLTGAR